LKRVVCFRCACGLGQGEHCIAVAGPGENYRCRKILSALGEAELSTHSCIL